MGQPTPAELAAREQRATAATNLRSLSDVYELLALRARERDHSQQMHQASNDFACILEEMAAYLEAGRVGPEELAVFRRSADQVAAAIEGMIRAAVGRA